MRSPTKGEGARCHGAGERRSQQFDQHRSRIVRVDRINRARIDPAARRRQGGWMVREVCRKWRARPFRAWRADSGCGRSAAVCSSSAAARRSDPICGLRAGRAGGPLAAPGCRLRRWAAASRGLRAGAATQAVIRLRTVWIPRHRPAVCNRAPGHGQKRSARRSRLVAVPRRAEPGRARPAYRDKPAGRCLQG